MVLVLAAGASFLYLCNDDHSTVYYTMVDNNRVKEQTTAASSGAGSYEYHLDTYDADGNMKSLSFKTSRELREGAYLKLEVMPVRGVISWEEYEGFTRNSKKRLSELSNLVIDIFYNLTILC